MAVIKAAKNIRDPTETPNIFVSLRNSEVLQKAVARFSASPFRFWGKLCMVGGAFKQVLLCVQHDPAVFDGYFEAFDGGVFFFGPRLLDGDIVGADAQAVGVEDGAAGGDVELPAVPGAAENPAVAFPDDLAGGGGAGRCR